MDDIDDGLNSYPQSDDTLAPDEQPLPNPPAAKAPYRRQTPHITQSPIDDVEPSYVTRERYVTLEQARGGRKHMGTATSDPQYLSPTGYEKNGHLSPNASRERDGGRATVHYERYLQTQSQVNRFLFPAKSALANAIDAFFWPQSSLSWWRFFSKSSFSIKDAAESIYCR